MTTFSNAAAIVEEIRAGLVAMLGELTPNVNAAGQFYYIQADCPYWTTAFGDLTGDKIGTHTYRFSQRISLYYHVEALTAGVEGEVEQGAQEDLLRFSVALLERPMFESTAYPDGVDYAEPVENVTAAMRIVSRNGTMTRAVVIAFDVPFTLQIQEY
jgi:hypothetical protein